MDITNLSIITHVYMIYILLSIMIFNLFSVFMIKKFMVLAKLLKFMTPLYHLANAMVIYTGVIVMAYTKEVSAIVILMIGGAIFLLVIEIKRYKKMRVIKTSDVALQCEFYSYAKKIYSIEIVVLVFIYIVSKIF